MLAPFCYLLPNKLIGKSETITSPLQYRLKFELFCSNTVSLMSAYLKKLLLLALAYFIAGKLSLLLAIPPGFATPVWPAAGIAFAAVFLWGYRLLPAVFAGSFAINLFIASESGADIFQLSSVLVASGIALGALVQAAVSVYLVKKFIGDDAALENEKAVFYILIMGGCVGTLTNAIIGPLILLSAGIISHNDFTVSWYTWWIGDAIGVILFAPLILITTAKHTSFIRKLTVAVPILIIFALAVVLFSFARNAEQQSLSEKFISIASHKADLLKDRMQVFQENLFPLKRHYLASDNVTRNEFSTFSRDSVSKYNAIQAFAWVPRVAFKQKSSFEKAAHKDGYTGFKIRELKDGKLVAASKREFYYPVFYVEPLRSNIKAFGVDLGSEPIRKGALEQAMDQGKAIATKGLHLIQGPGKKKGFLIFDPVYHKNMPLNTLENRRKALKGFTLGVFRIDLLVEGIFNKQSSRDLNLYVYDHGYGGAPEYLYGEKNAQSPFYHKVILDVAGRKWVLHFTPSKIFLQQQYGWQSWLVLIGGLLFVSLLQAFLLVISANTEFFKREAAEKSTELVNSREQHQAVFENSVDGLILISSDGTIVSFNPASEDIFGYSKEEVIGKNIKILMPSPYQEEHDDYLKSYIDTGQKKIIGIGREVEGLNKNGRIFPVDLSICEITLNGEKFFSGFVRDISDRKFAEEELQKVSKKLQLILDHAGEGVYGLDIEGNTIFANKAAEKILGYSQEDMLNTCPHELIHHHRADGSVYPKEECKIYDSIRDGNIHKEDTEVFWKKDGTSIPVEYSSTPIRDKDRNITGAVVVFRDITERKKAEEELVRSNMELERFAYVASHDLQEPLRMISSFTNLLQEKYSSTFDDTGHKYMGFISNAADRMRDLVVDLLEYSRADQDMETLKEIDCSDILKGVEESLSEIIQSSEAIITSDPLPMIYSNEIRIYRLIQNLIGNAIKYQSPGNIPTIHIGVEDKDTHWIFSVSDNGIGIPEDQIDHVFVLFKRLNQNTYSGTGIGLSICKKVVESLGGKIWVDSTFGKGSTFYFSIPKIIPDEEAA